MIVLDANVLVAHLNERDAFHEAATRLLNRTGGARLVAHPLTWAEVLVGGARLGRTREMRADLESMGIEVAVLDDDHSVRLAELRVATRLKMPDCCVLDTARIHTGALASFDGGVRLAAERLGLELFD